MARPSGRGFFGGERRRLKRFCKLRIRFVTLLGGAIQTHEDSRQKIIEIMRDAASQLADRLHFLRLPQHVLRQLTLLGLPLERRQGGVALLYMQRQSFIGAPQLLGGGELEHARK